jgi:hypothetical protein
LIVDVGASICGHPDRDISSGFSARNFLRAQISDCSPKDSHITNLLWWVGLRTRLKQQTPCNTTTTTTRLTHNSWACHISVL